MTSTTGRDNPKQRIGIIGAMAAEVQALVDSMVVENSGEDSGFSFWSGQLAGKQCLVARSGMGKVAAAACAQRLIDRWDVSCIVVCGLAGGLADGLRLGDVVIGDGHLQHDVDASPIFPRFELPGTGLSVIHPDPEIVAAAFAASQAFLERGLGGATTYSGLIVTGDQFVNSDRRQEIRRAVPEAKCVEMEGAAIAQVCYLNQTSFIVVRIISDSADHDAATDFSRFVDEVAPSYVEGIVSELLPRL